MHGSINLSERKGKGINYMVTITRSNGEVHTNPYKVKIERNESTELFYKLLEDYEKMEETK